MTEREAKVLGCIRRYIHERGISPSLHEIQDLTGIPYSTVRNCVMRLHEAGYLSKSDGKVRSLSIRIAEDKDQNLDKLFDLLIRLGDLARTIKYNTEPRKELADGFSESFERVS